MARKTSRRRSSRRTPRLDFAAIEIVGALLTPDIVARIASFESGDQTEEAYRIPPGLKVRDEIARYFRIGEALWHQFDAAKGNSPVASERFVLTLFKECFGFDGIKAQETVHKGERDFPVRHASLDGRVPIVIAPVPVESARRSGIDESLGQFGDGSRRRSATLLLQEYLNAEDDALWGICTDGLTLRLLRDNVSLTRPAWIEADLARIFTEGLFPDFSALWLLIHQSRFGRQGALAADSALERWHDTGRIEGVAARDKLRQGVEQALLELGQGFIEQPANNDLRKALTDGSLTRQAYFEELLRLVYRLIFLFAAEDRDLLHLPGASQAVTKAYADGYSVARLRERCTRRTSWDKNTDVWEGLKATFHALAEGQPLLGLPALGGLFTHGQHPHLRASRIENRRMLAAIWRLAWMRPEGQPLTRVNWRDMETEELGSVYEGLLELTPQVSASERSFAFAEGSEGRGNARKTSGSYYTPDALVQALLDETLDPLIEETIAGNDDQAAIDALLNLRMIDPACGSGHFLLAAARRLASRIARLSSPGTPSQADYRHWLREVSRRTLFGVDKNPMAIEIAKVALWIETVEPGKPLSFLDAHLRCGDSLLGVYDLGALQIGIPDDAYEPLTADDKKAAGGWKARNKSERDARSQGELTFFEPPKALLAAARKLEQLAEDDLAAVQHKAAAFRELFAGADRYRLEAACDLYVAAFLMPKVEPPVKTVGGSGAYIPTSRDIWDKLAATRPLDLLEQAATSVARAVRAFHWPLEFPQVFFPAAGKRPCFDVVLGNPPWERIKLQEQEFFAALSPEIATAPTKAARQKLIEALSEAPADSPDKALYQAFVIAKRNAEAASVFARTPGPVGGRYPYTGAGDVNTYALFAELFATMASHAGAIVPTGIATDATTAPFFAHLVRENRLTALIDFENREGLFPAVDSRMKFCVLAMRVSTSQARFSFFLTNPSQIADSIRRFTLSSAEISAINPNTLTAPIFRTKADADLTALIHKNSQPLIRERPTHEGGDINPWGFTYQTKMFDMTDASHLFESKSSLEARGYRHDGINYKGSDDRYSPLYESKMIHYFDHRWATFSGADAEEGFRDCTADEKNDPRFEPVTRYYVPELEVEIRASRVPVRLKTALRSHDDRRCSLVLAEWLLGYVVRRQGLDPRSGSEKIQSAMSAVLGSQVASRDALGTTFPQWLAKAALSAGEMDQEHPLSDSDIELMKVNASQPLELVRILLKKRLPRWLMGWRGITNATNERTSVFGCFPLAGAGNSIKVCILPERIDAIGASVFLSIMSSLVLDYAARFKIGGTNFSIFIAKQFPVLAPSQVSDVDRRFIAPRVLELTYTSNAMKNWAEDLGYPGPPFPWNEERRSLLRAELDAKIAKLYGLSRDQLRYILDPADIYGADFPSESFRILKNNEVARYNEYRTARLVMQAFDELTAGTLTTEVVEVGTLKADLRYRAVTDLQERAWSRPRQDQRGETGATMVALLKAMQEPIPAVRVRLAAILALEPRLLHSYLNRSQSAEWKRLVGDEADPLPSGAVQFVPPTDQHWGAVVRGLRTSGALIEDSRTGTWAPGTGLDQIDTQGWPDGRARFVLDALLAADEDTVVRSLPAEVRRWLDAEAA